MPKEMMDEINKRKGTKLDFSKLFAWEGGAYQYGSANPGMIKAVATNDRNIIPKDVREHDYLFNSMPAQTKNHEGENHESPLPVAGRLAAVFGDDRAR